MQSTCTIQKDRPSSDLLGGASALSEDKKAEFKNHYPFIDGLRALAALLVMAHHEMGPISGLLSCGAGAMGVPVFFVISGFVITGYFIREVSRTHRIDLRTFFFGRFLRLTPAFWVFLLFIFFTNPGHTSKTPAACAISALYLSDYDISLGWNNVWGSGCERSWTLAVEEKFYLVWPLLLTLCRFRFLKAAVIGLLLATACVALIPPPRLFAFDFYANQILVGCIAAILLQNQKVQAFLKKQNEKSAIIVPLLCFASAVLFTNPIDPVIRTIGFLLFFLLMPLVLMLFAVNENFFLARVCSFPLLRKIGLVSYSLYLWHGVCFYYIDSNLKSSMNPFALEFLRLAASLALACVSYFLLERPFQSLRRALKKSA